MIRLRFLVLLMLPAVGAQAGDMIVTGFQQLTANGGRVAWSPGPNNLIAFDRPNSSGIYDVWTMNPDGSNQVCLTCNFAPLLGYHKGNPDWHPSGNYIVFQAQRTDINYASSSTSTPGVGIDNVLWIMDAAGQNFWQILPNNAFQPHAGGVLHAHFSHDGNTLLWAQLTDSALTHPPDGNWEIQLASFAVTNGTPAVTITQTLQPGPCHNFYETHGFSLDDKTIFFSGNPSCQSHFGTDIYSSDLHGGNFVNLTNTPNAWDEHSRPAPNQEKLIWVSSVGTATTSSPLLLLLECWTMNYDGSDKKKLTWFTDARAGVCTSTNCTNPSSLPAAATVSDNDWNHDGTQSVVYLINPSGGGGSTLGSNGSIWLMTLAPSSTTASSGSYANYPQAPDSIAVSFGTDLANGTLSASTIPLPTNLAGTSAVVTDAQGIARPAPLFFSSANQVNWYVPAGTVNGPATIVTTSGDGTVSRDIFDVENSAPALYAIDGTGSGPAAGYVVTPAQQLIPVYKCAPACVALPVDVSSGGSVLVLYGTGVRHHQNPVTATVGTTTVATAYAGAQADYLGLDQINIPLAASLAGSGLVSVSLNVDGMLSNAVQIWIK